jgi:hypothetical protein
MDGRHALLLFGIRRNAGRLLPGEENDKEKSQKKARKKAPRARGWMAGFANQHYMG